MFNAETRKIILNVLEYFQNEKENSVHPISALKCTAAACKISEKTVARIRKEYITGTSPRVNREKRALKTRDLTEAKRGEIRNVVYDMIAMHKYVTRQKLKEELHAKQIIDLSNSSLGHLLKHLGFKFKRDSGRRYIMEKPDIVSKRIKFLRQYTENMLSESSLDVVFIDETWIFQNGSDIRTWHDDNMKSVLNKKQSDGKRYIVLHAGTRDGFVDGADLLFSTKNKSADYHDNMNSKLFEKWLEEQLLPRLENPSLIVMDNARYHSRLSEDVPNASTRKAEIISWLQSKNIIFLENALKPELLQIVKQYKANLRYAVDEIIVNMGHQVLRLPPYHCIFNAIELIWAQCKTFFNKEIIGKDRKDENAVLDVWKQALRNVTPENWSDCVNHTNNIIKDYWQKEHIEDVKPLIINVSDSDSDSDICLSSDSD